MPAKAAGRPVAADEQRVSFGFSENDAMFLAALVRRITTEVVTEVVQRELQAAFAAAVETAKDHVATLAEIEKSARLIVDGQALVEKSVLGMMEAFAKATGTADSRADDWWRDGAGEQGPPDAGD